MTTADTPATSTEIATSLRHGRVTLTEVVQTFADAPISRTAAVKTPASATKPPTSPVLTDKIKTALLSLPHVFDQVVVTERRALSADEVVQMHAEFTALKTIGDTLTKRLEVLKENIRTHVDVVSEASGEVPADVELDAAGHYILASKGNPVRIPIEGANEEFSLEYNGGRAGTVKVSSEELLDLYEAGDITRDQYLSLTREVRVFDEEKATKAIIADPTLVSVVRQASRRTGATAPSQSLYLRNVKA